MADQKIKKSPEVKALEDLLREAEAGRRTAELLFTEIHDMVISVIGPHTNALDAYKIGPMRDKLRARIAAGDAAIKDVQYLKAKELLVKGLRMAADGDADKIEFHYVVTDLEAIAAEGNLADGPVMVISELRAILDRKTAKKTIPASEMRDRMLDALQRPPAFGTILERRTDIAVRRILASVGLATPLRETDMGQPQGKEVW